MIQLIKDNKESCDISMKQTKITEKKWIFSIQICIVPFGHYHVNNQINLLISITSYILILLYVLIRTIIEK